MALCNDLMKGAGKRLRLVIVVSLAAIVAGPMGAAIAAPPSVTLGSNQGLSNLAVTPLVAVQTPQGARFEITSAAAGDTYAINVVVTADAEL